jgi:hypothetical protein
MSRTMEGKLPLKKIFDKAFIGYVYALPNPRCFASPEDAENPIPVYDLDMVDEIYFRENCKRTPKEDPDDVRVWSNSEIDHDLIQQRAIYVRRVKLRSDKKESSGWRRI